jgi:hypothetical protein
MGRDMMSQLNGLEKLKKHLGAKEQILIHQAMHSTDPNVLVKANNMMNEVIARDQSDRKSFMFDPNDFSNSMGFKDKPVNMSYDILRRISYTVPIIRSIINTRIDQISDFCEPQKDKYSTGFVIRKKAQYFGAEAAKPTKADNYRAHEIAEIIMNCGVNGSYANDDFDEFTRKIFNDSYTFDQMTFEVVRDRRGKLFEFVATDGSTIRIADSYDTDTYDARYQSIAPLNRKQIKGYYPAYCQVDMGQVVADFYPWEMCFGIRNPTSSIYSRGYGVSEPEILVNTITSMLWADEYNRRFFSQGSAPKGLLKVKGGTGANNAKIAEFKQKWQSMMAGVYNSWKTPILEADVDWIDLQKSNRDMEFGHWTELLIKTACAVYRIDPAEVNFPLSGSSEQKALFEGNNEARLKHSKDKGLRPALKFYQRKLNKFVLPAIDPEWEIAFVGLDNDDPSKDLDNDIKQVGNMVTLDEIRAKRGLKALGKENGGAIVLNPVWMQWFMGQQQMEMQQQQMDMQQDQFNTQMDAAGSDDQQKGMESDPIAEAYQKYLDKTFTTDAGAE